MHSRGFQNLCKPQIRIFFTYVFFFYKNAWFFIFLAIFSSNLNKNSNLQSKQNFFIHTFVDSNRSSFAGCNQRLSMSTILFVLRHLKIYISVKNAFAWSPILFIHTAYIYHLFYIYIVVLARIKSWCSAFALAISSWRTYFSIQQMWIDPYICTAYKRFYL